MLSTIKQFNLVKQINSFDLCYDPIYKTYSDKRHHNEKYIENIDEYFQNSTLTSKERIEHYIVYFNEVCKLLKYQSIQHNFKLRVPNISKQIVYDALSKRILDENGNDIQEELDDFEKNICIRNNASFIYVNSDLKTDENTTCYDLNSYYASCLMSSCIRLLTKKGKIQTLETFLEDLYNSAYYKCKIDLNNCPINYKKLTTDIVWLTNLDVMAFKTTYNFPCDLVNEGNNAYVYEKCKSTFRDTTFRSVIPKLYEIKKTNPLVKKILSCLHGVMFATRKKHHEHMLTNVNANCSEDEDIDNNFLVAPCLYGDVDKTIFENKNMKFNKEAQYYHHRNAQFYYSYVRYFLHKQIATLTQNNMPIYRVYYDSITTSKNDFLKVDTTIGAFKIENKKYAVGGYFENAKTFNSN